jgi:HEAT repeat protein
VNEKDVPRIVAALAVRINPIHPVRAERETQVSVRYEAAQTLKRFYKDARPAIPALVEGTRDKGSWELRHQCAWILWRVAADPKNGPDGRAVDALLDMLRNPKCTYLEKMEAIQGLGGMGRPGDSTRLSRVLTDLGSCTNPRNPENRPLVIWAYASLVNLQDNGDAKVHLAKLAKYLKSTDLEMRVQAAGAMASLGAKAKPRLPDLIAMLKDKESVVVMAATMALSNVGDSGDKVVDALLDVTDHKEPATAATAIIALVNLKANTPAVVKKLDKMHGDKKLDDDLRKTVGQALKALREKKDSK